jgi:hypothetical protein
VAKKCKDLGLRFRWWQPPIGRLILAKRADGTYASTIGGCGLSICRQTGKTFLVGAIVFALCLLRPRLTVLWTAHRLRTAEETFGKMQAFAKRKRIAPHVEYIHTGAGEQEVKFWNGSRILFGARESGFGLGFDEVDVIIFDEAQRLKSSTLDDMVPAANQTRQPEGALLLFMGTPPRPDDNGDVFAAMRAEALSDEDEDTAWVEFGADPGHVFTPLPGQLTDADWAQIAKANPSFPDDTPKVSILRMRKKLGSDSFAREGAGQWDAEKGPGIMPNWSTLSTTSDPPPVTAIGIAVDVDRVWCSIGAAAVSEDRAVPYVGTVVLREAGRARVPLAELVELTDGDERRKVPLVVAEAARIQRETGCVVLADKKGPVGSLEDDLTFAGVDMLWLGLEEVLDACANFFDAVATGMLEHNNDPDLNSAVEAVGWRKVGDRQLWARRTGNIVELEAVTVALYGADQTTEAWGFWE